MQERGFSSQNAQHRITMHGGQLWKIKPRKEQEPALVLDEDQKTLHLYLRPHEPLPDVFNEIYSLLQKRNLLLYIYFAINRRLPSILILLPVSVTVFVIAFIGLYGEFAIEWIFSNEDTGTIFGLTRREGLIYSTILAILLLYFFPVFLTGEQDGFIRAINDRFSAKTMVKSRFVRILSFFVKRKIIQRVEIWNPDFSQKESDWIEDSLLPALMKLDLEIELFIKIDERSSAERFVAELVGENELEWKEIPHNSENFAQPIPYNYLESWEKLLLSVYVFASTANLPNKWLQLVGNERDGVLRNVVSLRLIKEIVDRFKERLFPEEDRDKLLSMDAFASRCLNDYGILSPLSQYSTDVWKLSDIVVKHDINRVRTDMKYIYGYLQLSMDRLEDCVSALILNSVHTNVSIHDYDRLEAVRFFVRVIHKTEEYKVLKQYWNLIIANPNNNDLNEDVYRILGVELLDDLAFLFERAAMYDYAFKALDYIEKVYPYRGKTGKGRILERQGNFNASVELMVGIRNSWKKGEISLEKYAATDLNLNIAWAIVSGRLEQHQALGKETVEEARVLLYSDFDKIRDTDHIVGLYNILANYAEWENNPEEALANYEKGLQIPGIAQAALSNLFVNQGIALRQTKKLAQAILYGEQGVEIKAALGDADQLPIAQHNLAQTCLEYAFSIPQEGRVPYFEKAQLVAQTGLDIQNQTGSIKKRGQLLTERFIAEYQLASFHAKPYKTTLEYWEKAREWLHTENREGRGQTYDCKVVVKELLWLLPEFKNKELTDCIKQKLAIE